MRNSQGSPFAEHTIPTGVHEDSVRKRRKGISSSGGSDDRDRSEARNSLDERLSNGQRRDLLESSESLTRVSCRTDNTETYSAVLRTRPEHAILFRPCAVPSVHLRDS